MKIREAKRIIKEVSEGKTDISELPDEYLEEVLDAISIILRRSLIKNWIKIAMWVLVFITCVTVLMVSMNELLNIISNL